MNEYRHEIVLSCVGLYMLACLWVGIWAWRRTHSVGDFFMAGRSLGMWVTAMAVFSSTLSGFGFVGGPGLVYRMGMSSIWIVICATVGHALKFYLLGKRIRVFSEVYQPNSLADVVAIRYGSQTTRLLISLAILAGVMSYLGAQILAMATVLQQLVAENNGAQWSLELCVALSTTVLVFYCVTGGIVASVYTDLFQGTIMLLAALLVFFTAATCVDGGFTQISQTIMQDNPAAMGPWGTLGMMGCLSWYFLFAMGGTGQPHVITKFMMNRRMSDVKYIYPLALLGFLMSALLWLSVGLVMRTLVLQGLHPELSTADAAAPQFLQHYAHPVLAGIVFAALFAAIMSTADGFLNVGAAAIVHDIPQALRGNSLKRELLWVRLATVGMAVVAALFALYSPFSLVALLGKYGWGVFAAACVPVVAIGFNWQRANALAANTTLICGLVMNLGVLLAEVWGLSISYGIDSSALTLLLSLVIFIIVSLLSPQQPLPDDVRQVMEI